LPHLVDENIHARLDGVATMSEGEGIADFAAVNVGERGLKKFRPTTRSVTAAWRTVASGLMLLAKPGSLSRA